MFKKAVMLGVMSMTSFSGYGMHGQVGQKLAVAGLTFGVPLSVIAAGLAREYAGRDRRLSEQEQANIERDRVTVERFVELRCTHVLESEPLDADGIRAHEQCSGAMGVISKAAAAAHRGDRGAQRELRKIAAQARRIEAGVVKAGCDE